MSKPYERENRTKRSPYADRTKNNPKRSSQPAQSRPPMPQNDDREPAFNLIEGRNAVHETLASGRSIEKVFVLDNREDGRLMALAAECRANGAQLVSCDRRKLDAMSETGAHQGIIAVVSEIDYATVADIFARAESSGRPPLIVICDHLSDPQNLGAIVRSAEVFGAHGVIIPKRLSLIHI